jgi:hypothetical protein
MRAREAATPDAIISREDSTTTRLRKGPTAQSEFNDVILFEGDEVAVISRGHHDESTEFWLVQDGRKRGFIDAQYVKMIAVPTEAAPPVSVPAEAEASRACVTPAASRAESTVSTA